MDFFSYLKQDLHINLNDQQVEAVKAADRRILLEACPGSGKTTTLVVRIAYQILCRNVGAAGMLTLTFSRASAKDMERRFAALFSSLIPQPVHFSTIHSFCYRFLYFCQKKRLLTVPELIEKDNYSGKSKILRSLFFEINQEYPGEDQTEQLSNEISYVKNKLIEPEQLKSDFENFPMIFRHYEAYKREKQLIDFDDMLSMTYELLQKNRELYREYGVFPQVLVDEAQDTSLLQHRIIEELSREGSLFMVGDTDQSIYGFRGAEPDYIVNIRDLYPDAKILRLETNYRSSGKIVQLSNQFICQNVSRHQKNMSTGNETGEMPAVFNLKDMEEQLQKVMQLVEAEPFKTAVLYRKNLSGLPIAWELIQRGIPFYIREDYSSFFRHFVVADVFSFFSFAENPCDLESFRKIYYKMGAALSKNDLRKAEKSLDSSSDLKKHQQSDILTLLLRLNHHRKHAAGHLVRIRRGMNRILRSNPWQALEVMEEELQYGDYLKRNTGYVHVFHTLKHFARNTKTLEEFKTRMRTLKNGIDHYYSKAAADAVHLLTLHGSKGLEFDNVIVVDLIEGWFPDENSLDDLNAGNRKAYEEEVRLFYVGVTRAKKKVFLLSPRKVEGGKVMQSRFIRQFIHFEKAEELGEGQIVHHTKFGEGVVKHCEDGVAEILFNRYGYRKLSVTVCMESGMLKTD
ncbi:MAG: ATP-dependent helicase [Thermoclostridium sp.]|nr:ATP-dependent helicase [Thermoclostridium sp.]